ncbi:hypothetical protein TNCV_5102841 [Trichonephila clavipes]|nr:hypothetical protein TNCV_5102841 [Trichonephila clavipes]
MPDRTAGRCASNTCAVVISTETESGFIIEDDTSPVCHTPSCPRSAKSSRHCLCGSVVSVLADVGSSSQLQSVVSLWFLLMALDVWKEVSGVESMLATLLVPKWPLFWIARSSRSFVFLGRPDPPRRYTLPSVIHCCQHRATTISLRPRWRPIRLFDPPASLRRPLSKVRQLLVLPPLRLRGILSLNIVYQSHQIRLDSRTALVLMVLNSPSCATNMHIAHLALSH